MFDELIAKLEDSHGKALEAALKDPPDFATIGPALADFWRAWSMFRRTLYDSPANVFYASVRAIVAEEVERQRKEATQP